MGGYWARHRLFVTIIVCAAIAFISGFLFVYPTILQQAQHYNAQSIYRNSTIDFIAPEPSFDQTSEIAGTHGIKDVFPYFLTKTTVSINGKTRTTTVLLSDQFQKNELTMYNKARLIKESSIEYDNPVLVDWQFCHDTSAGLGDVVSITIGGISSEYRINAIYETNSIYDGGAILVGISNEQKTAINQQSNNNGYSGMYISASDYNACQSYLTSAYRPLGRLKDRSQFSSDEQYQVHYDAIMSAGYANEITDFRIKEATIPANKSSFLPWFGGLMAAVLLLCFNILMSRRGCEKVYFTKQCIPKGLNVKPYYFISFVCEVFLSVALYSAILTLRIQDSNDYIPSSTIGFGVALVPLAIIAAECVNLFMNNAMVSDIVRKGQLEKQKEKRTTTAEQK